MMGKRPDYIKKRLRWRSDSYEDYLRHIPAVAQEQASTITNYFTSQKDKHFL